MSDWATVMELIGNDIIEVLKENNNIPMSHDDLYENTKLKHYHYNGYGYAIDVLRKRKLLKYSDEVGDFGTIYYELT